MTEQPLDEKRGALRRNIYDTYMQCIWKSQEVSVKLAGGGGNIRNDAIEFRGLTGILFLYTQYDKGLEKTDRNKLADYSWWLAQRVPSQPQNVRRYAKYGLRCFQWYQQMLVQNGVIVVEND